MRTYSGFKKDMQFDVEVIKDYEDGGYGQIVRGAHMRLHAGTHVDAPSHMLKGATDLQDVPLHTYFGDAIIADVRHRGGGEAITPGDLERPSATSSCLAIVFSCGPTRTSNTTARRSG